MLLVQGVDVLAQLVDSDLQSVVLRVLVCHRHQLLVVLLELAEVLLVEELVLPDFEFVLLRDVLALLSQDNVTALYHTASVGPELLSGKKPSEKDESTVLRVFQVKAVGEGDHEQRHEEHAPEGSEDADDAATVRLGVVIAVSNSGQGNNNVPHGSVDVLKVDVHFSLEDLEAQTQLNQREQKGVQNHLDWILDHERFEPELEVCIDSKYLAASLGFWVGPLRELNDVNVGWDHLEEDLEHKEHVVYLEVEVG